MTVRAIFVVDEHGRWKDEASSSRSISNAADYEYLKKSRSWSDCIVSSGKTVRDNHYSPISKPLVIISRSPEAHFQRLVESGATVVADEVEHVIYAQSQKHKNVLLEFGPASIQQAITAKLIDELDVSVTGSMIPDLKWLVENLPFDFSGWMFEPIHEAPSLHVFRFFIAA